ncbi:phosphate ABC transporter permease subunit PstC [Microbacterium capsulatum]|uniref:Phosphate transport system permease protein n=1 Tax=Microbacterium capsulatum TaxID=3041921 RepID=A0ABU0XH02_9MICO|nr:phosphate ABC transporter permease subunit PstC [Microbacterium sp. ASV81]MDQ4214412.1 phosphate ABC transporter permease subunit PstC [Microbacterium sp. ASV81]
MSSLTETAGGRAPQGPAAAAVLPSPGKAGDRVFLGLSTGAAWLIMVILAGVAIFLIIQAAPAIAANWATNTQIKDPTAGNTVGFANIWTYVGPLIFGTIWASFLALLFGAPVALGIALFISHYAPRRMAGILGYVIDLLAAVPSVVFGLWGLYTMRQFLIPFNRFAAENLSWLPFFHGTASAAGGTILAGAIVLAVMILPIMTSISREIFLQTPQLHEEAALALGATRWEMIRLAVFPYARSGVISAVLLGLGRALGETMAIAMIVSPKFIYSFVMIGDDNPGTIAANIALQFGGSNGLQRQALIATGLALFVISFAVNFVARWIVARSAPGTRRTKAPKTKEVAA